MEVQGYPNYVIYEDGRVWSKKTNRILKQTFMTSGYKRVHLCNHPIKNQLSVHRLVAIHFIPNPLNKPHVHHEDGNKLNNHVSNLRWLTHIENLNEYKSIRGLSNHRGISYCNRDKNWRYGKIYHKKHIFARVFKSKTDALCYKFYILLKINIIKSKGFPV